MVRALAVLRRTIVALLLVLFSPAPAAVAGVVAPIAVVTATTTPRAVDAEPEQVTAEPADELHPAPAPRTEPAVATTPPAAPPRARALFVLYCALLR